MDANEIIAIGRRVLRVERESLGLVEDAIDERFASAVQLIAQSTGRVIVSGVGKSGLIGRKIAATLTSTGTPATFLHPLDSVHGDLGIVGTDDVAILISKSGESDELMALLEHLQGLGVRTVAITASTGSQLGRATDIALSAHVREEACPHDLAPTSSTTAALAVGDAIAVALLEYKGFRREDFARIHPGGALGRRLVTRVDDIMITDQLPVLAPTATMREAVVVLAERRGIVVVADDSRRLLGVMTAGDLTRLMEHEADVMTIVVDRVMTARPRTARSGELASAAAYRMEKHGIMAMPVVDDADHVVGVVHLHDLLRARVA
jgi:arabinose-5-phosphate isomerase